MKYKLNSKVGWTTISYDQNEFAFDKIIEKKILEFLSSDNKVIMNKIS